jgi:hypothetical protein
MVKADVKVEKKKEPSFADKVQAKEKKIVVTMTDKGPEVDFWGLWTGAELTIVERAIRRAYSTRKHLIVRNKLV